MKFNKKFCLLILILFFVSLSFASAVSDNQTDELISNDGLSVDAATFENFSDEVQTAGDTIDLKTDYVYNDNFTVDGIVIDKPITINGNGKTFDGKNSARIFNITADNVVINNVNFVNGFVPVNESSPDNGAAIYCTGANLIINNCTFTNNQAGCYGGGAVFIGNDGSQITDSEFIRNTGSNSGGAIKLTGSNHTIANNIFEQNTAKIRHGGAMYIVADNVKLINNIFTSNVANYAGGAFRAEGSNITVSQNKFTSNNAKQTLGGGACILGNNNEVSDNYFTQNNAGRDGGGLDIEGNAVDEAGINNVVKNNVFISNTVGSYGGGMSMFAKEGTVYNNTFEKNTAGKLGGGFRVSGVDKDSVKISENIFTENTAGVSGGALYINASGTEIDNNTFTSNKAESVCGGAVNIHGNDNVITNNDFKSNSANLSGGAIYCEGNNFKMEANTLASNNAGTSGGALYITGNQNATVSDNKFIENTAGSLGGAGHIKCNTTTIKGNEFNKNVAGGSGGALYTEGKSMSITNNTFDSNKAGADSVGGGIRHLGDNAVITDNLFIDNTAKQGLSIYGDGDNEKIAPNVLPVGDNQVVWKSSKLATTLTVPYAAVVVTATTKAITVTLTDENGNAVADRYVNVTVNGRTYTVKTNATGVATANVVLKVVNSYAVTTVFGGDAQYKASTVKSTIKVKKDKTRLITPTYTYKRSLPTKKIVFGLKTKSGKRITNTPIYIKINGVTYKATTNSKGYATVKVKLTKKSTYIYKVTFKGTGLYYEVSQKGYVKVI